MRKPNWVRCKNRKPGIKHYYKRVLYKPEWSGSRWNEFLTGYATGSHLQVCCGASMIGDVRIDVTRDAPGITMLADMYRLPFSARSFDTVSCDPPYGIANQLRVHLQRELSRIARKRIIFKAPWIPRANGWLLRPDLLTMIGSHTCANVSVLSILDRKNETIGLFQ